MQLKVIFEYLSFSLSLTFLAKVRGIFFSIFNKFVISFIHSIFWIKESLSVNASSEDTPPAIEAWVQMVIKEINKFFLFLISLFFTTTPESPSYPLFKSTKSLSIFPVLISLKIAVTNELLWWLTVFILFSESKYL